MHWDFNGMRKRLILLSNRMHNSITSVYHMCLIGPLNPYILEQSRKLTFMIGLTLLSTKLALIFFSLTSYKDMAILLWCNLHAFMRSLFLCFLPIFQKKLIDTITTSNKVTWYFVTSAVWACTVFGPCLWQLSACRHLLAAPCGKYKTTCKPGQL